MIYFSALLLSCKSPAFGVAFAAAKIDQHQDKYWKDLIETYIQQQTERAQSKHLGTNEDKFYRPAYDFYKEERGHAPTRYMKAISDLQDKRLDNISNLIRKIDLNIIELMELCQKYNNKDRKDRNNPHKTKHFVSHLRTFDHEMPPTNLYDEDGHYHQNEIEKIVSLYTKIFIRLMTVAVEIQKFDDYMQFFVDGFLDEVGIALNLYMPLLKMDNSKVSDIVNFANNDKNFRSFFNNSPNNSNNNSRDWIKRNESDDLIVTSF